MLSPKPQMNLRNAKTYFREHLRVGDYYAEGQTIAGEWYGEAAGKLGLSGKVGEKEFLAMCEGLHPGTGEWLTARKNSTRLEDDEVASNRRVFYDFTFSPPKSVSVVALLQDLRIVELHNRAVRMAMLELEKFAETRVRQDGQDGERTTGNMVAAVVTHDANRALDPQELCAAAHIRSTSTIRHGKTKARPWAVGRLNPSAGSCRTVSNPVASSGPAQASPICSPSTFFSKTSPPVSFGISPGVNSEMHPSIFVHGFGR